MTADEVRGTAGSGLYEEGLMIDKPLEILGQGPQQDVIVRARGCPVIGFQANIGRVSNLTLQQAGGGKFFGVSIAEGRLELEDCDIVSQSLSAVAVRGGADPRLRRNRIHDGQQNGIFVFEQGLGTIEDNDIFANALAGIAIEDGGNPTIRRNRINRNQFEAIRVYEGGRGTFEDNNLSDNARRVGHCGGMQTARPPAQQSRMSSVDARAAAESHTAESIEQHLLDEHRSSSFQHRPSLALLSS